MKNNIKDYFVAKSLGRRVRNYSPTRSSLIAIKNQQGGFLQIIILIIIVLLLMNYFHISISGIFNWLGALLNGVR